MSASFNFLLAVWNMAAISRWIGLLINIIILFLFLRSFYRSINEDSRDRGRGQSVTFLHISAIGSLLTFALLQLVNGLVFIFWTNVTLKIIESTITVFAFCFTMIFYVWRLRVSFKSSVYQLSQRKLSYYVIYIGITTLILILSQIATYINDIYITKNSNSSNNNDFNYDANDSAWGIAAIILTISALLLFGFEMMLVTWSFTTRLLDLILSQRSSIFSVRRVFSAKSGLLSPTTTHMGSMTNPGVKHFGTFGSQTLQNNAKSRNSTDSLHLSLKRPFKHQSTLQSVVDESLSERQRSLLKTIAIQCVLTNICVICVVLNCIFYGVIYLCSNLSVYSILQSGLTIVDVVVPMAIWLSFGFSRSTYFKLCMRCHKRSEYWYGVVTLWKLAKIDDINEVNQIVVDDMKNPNSVQMGSYQSTSPVTVDDSNSEMENDSALVA